MKTHLKLVVILVSIAVPVVLAACGSATGSNVAVNASNSNAATPAASTTATPGAASAIATLYKDNCAKCHQDSGKGGKVTVDGKQINAHDLTSDKMKKRDDQKFFDDIAEGSPDDGMPAFKGKLTDAQINDIIKYIHTDLQK